MSKAKSKKGSKKAEKKCKTYADKMDLTFDMLTDYEMKVATALNGKGSGARTKAMTLDDLCKSTGWKKSVGAKKGNSRVRNQLRRLVRGKWVEWVARGTYRISPLGRNSLKKSSKRKESKKAIVVKKARSKRVKVKKGNSAPPPKSIIPAGARAQL